MDAAEDLRKISVADSVIPLETPLTVLGHVGFTANTSMVHSVHTVADAFSHIPDAFASLSSGGSTGRMVVVCDS